MSITLDGTSGIVNDATDLNYTGTLTGGTGVVNLGSGQVYKDADGNVGIGTSSPAVKLHVFGSTTYAAGVETNTTYAFLGLKASGSGGTMEDPNVGIGATVQNLVLRAGGAERARIDSSGNLLVGTTNTNPVGADINGITLVPGGRTCISRLGGEVLGINRGTDDGTLISFAQAGSTEGNISVSGSTVSYNGGHLSRYAQTTTAKDESLVKGTVLSNLDAMNVYVAPTTYWTEEDELPEGVSVGDVKVETHSVENEQLNKVKVSDVEGDANVAGVFVNWEHDEAHNVDEINMAMTGDMIIRIASGVTVARGDLLMSAGDGTAKPQGDDIVRAKTIAKVTSTHVTCTYADGSFCVPCVLMAC